MSKDTQVSQDVKAIATMESSTVVAINNEPRSRSSLRWLLLVFVPLVAIVAGVLFYLAGGRYAETDNAYVKARMVLVSTDTPGRVLEVAVTDNQVVNAGDLLLRLDSSGARIAVQKADAQVAKVRAELAALRAQYRGKQTEIASARSRFAYAKKQEKRQQGLLNKNFVSASRYDDARQQADVAARQIGTLRQQLASISEQLGGDAKADDLSHPSYRAALALRDEAQLNLERTVVRATVSGVVSQLPEPGQYLKIGAPALALVANEGLWIQANFTETDLTHMREGQSVTVHIDAYPDASWQGRLASMSPATGAEFALIPAQNATGNWVKVPQRLPVRVELIQTESQPRLRAGLSAVVSVDTGHRRQLMGYQFDPIKRSFARVDSVGR